MRILRRNSRSSLAVSAVAAAMLIAACAPRDETVTAATAGTTGTDAETSALPESGCAVIESRNWTARVSGAADGAATLTVSGDIDLPTPGYSVSLKEGPADRRMPPAQHLLLELTPPDGMVSQVVTTVAVRYEGVATYPEYRAILVQCANRILATITEIERTD